MANLRDKLSRLPTVNPQANVPRVISRVQPQVSPHVSPQRSLASLPQVNPQKRRLIADLPAPVQLNAINEIIAGRGSTNEGLNAFVRNSATQGMSPEQIRQSFIQQQRQSANPLIIIS